MSNTKFRLSKSSSLGLALVLFFSCLLGTTLPAQQKSDRCYVIEIASEVDLGMVSYVERAVQKAEADHAVILLHLNTFGGRVDAATKIRDAILTAKVPLTLAFIDKRAISAGAFISLSAQKIVFSSGATMGAATPIYSSGEKASEKVVSYMRGEMRSTAERNHRDPRVAEAMVDESLGLDSASGLKVAPGKLLTLTTADARKVGYADTLAESIPEALAAVGYPGIKYETIQESFSDSLFRFLTNGFVSSLLIMIGLAGLFYSIKTGHFGGLTLIAVTALVLFFGAQYFFSAGSILAIVLFLIGCGLLLVEVSPIPSFGLAGVLGIAGLGLGLFLALAGDLDTLTPDRLRQTYVTLAIALIGFIILAILIIKYALKATWLRKFTNQATSGDTTLFMENRRLLLGKSGVAHTMLRPAGTAIIDGKKIDVVTNGEFIDPGTPLSVVDVAGNRIVVRAVKEAIVESAESKPAEVSEPFGGRLPNNLEPRV